MRDGHGYWQMKRDLAVASSGGGDHLYTRERLNILMAAHDEQTQSDCRRLGWKQSQKVILCSFLLQAGLTFDVSPSYYSLFPGAMALSLYSSNSVSIHHH